MARSSTAKPTASATMVCRDGEVRGAVRRTFSPGRNAHRAEHWSAAPRLLTCSYALRGGPLVLSVQDAVDAASGHAYFGRLRRHLAAHRIAGMESLGLPGYETAAGDVLFLKDGKTLHVDATRVRAASLPDGYDRSDAAYAIASAVLACWSE